VITYVQRVMRILGRGVRLQHAHYNPQWLRMEQRIGRAVRTGAVRRIHRQKRYSAHTGLANVNRLWSSITKYKRSIIEFICSGAICSVQTTAAMTVMAT